MGFFRFCPLSSSSSSSFSSAFLLGLCQLECISIVGKFLRFDFYAIKRVFFSQLNANACLPFSFSLDTMEMDVSVLFGNKYCLHFFLSSAVRCTSISCQKHQFSHINFNGQAHIFRKIDRCITFKSEMYLGFFLKKNPEVFLCSSAECIKLCRYFDHHDYYNSAHIHLYRNSRGFTRIIKNDDAHKMSSLFIALTMLPTLPTDSYTHSILHQTIKFE